MFVQTSTLFSRARETLVHESSLCEADPPLHENNISPQLTHLLSLPPNPNRKLWLVRFGQRRGELFM